MQNHREPGQQIAAACIALRRQRHERWSQGHLPGVGVLRLEAPYRSSVLGLDPSWTNHYPELPLRAQNRIFLPDRLLEGSDESTVGLDLHHRRETHLGDNAHERCLCKRHLRNRWTERGHWHGHLPNILPK